MHQFPTNRPPSPDGLSASAQSSPYPGSFPSSFRSAAMQHFPPPPAITIHFASPKCNVPLPRSSQDHAGPPEPSRPNASKGRPPRKLDNAKCQRCRRDKVKVSPSTCIIQCQSPLIRESQLQCSPQPREWPQKCDRCVGKGFHCSPSVVKQRVRKQLQSSPAPEFGTSSLASDHDTISESILTPRPTNLETMGTSTDVANFVWRAEDL